MKWREESLKLLEKAAQDEFVIDRLIDDLTSPDEQESPFDRKSARNLIKKSS